MVWIDDLVEFAASHLDDRGRGALYTRGVTDEQIELFRIGYLDRELPQLEGAKAFYEWSYGGSKLDDVFVLPLTNALGNIRGVQFRHVERSRGGYQDFFVDQDEPVLFGLAQAMPHVWATGVVYLVEGGFDLFPIQRTFPGVVATLTARAPDPFVKFLRRLVRKIWVGWDADTTGHTACGKFIRQSSREFEIQEVQYPKIPKVGGGLTKDPGELWESWGEIRFAEYLRSTLRIGNEEFGHAQSVR